MVQNPVFRDLMDLEHFTTLYVIELLETRTVNLTVIVERVLENLLEMAIPRLVATWESVEND